MKRVLFVDHVDRILGGAEINLVELIEEARHAGEWEIAVACREQSRLGDALRKLNVRKFEYGFDEALNTLRIAAKAFPWMRAWKGWRALLAKSGALREIIREFEADAVISCTNKDHFTAAIACQNTRAKSIWWVNDLITSDFFPAPARAAFKNYAIKAHKLVAVSNCVRASLQKLGIPSQKTVVIHNGIPLQKYQRGKRGLFRYRNGLPADAPLYGSIGRICAWKGQDLFLEIARQWIASNRPGHFVVIGQAFNEDQEFEERLRRDAQTDRIHFVPFQENVAEALTDLDALLHTARKPEPFGRVLIEAMAVGTAVIAANAGGACEIISDGESGFLAAANDLKDYTQKLAQLQDASLSSSFSAAGQKVVRERFTVKRVRQEFEKALFDLC
jgi:glycosyltransferase involved in cell wall biosynthesis